MDVLVTLRPPTLEECQQVRIWRNDPAVLPMLRTGYKTEEEQAAFYQDVVSNPDSDHRYYALTVWRPVQDFGQESVLVGMGGLTYLSRVHGEAEISLILGPEFRGRGLGVSAVVALMAEALNLDLRSVIGECYIGGAVKFWQAITLIQWRTWKLTEPFRLVDGSYKWKWERA